LEEVFDMTPFKRNFLQHAHAVGEWMRTHQARGGLDVQTLQMEIKLGDQAVRLYPQFTGPTEDGGMVFSNTLAPHSDGFVGWYPYQGKAWPAAQSKLAFKQLAAKHQLRVPAWTQDLSQVKGAFIVKADCSSLGRGLHGPYRVMQGQALPQGLGFVPGEYAEQFIMGRLLKAWYWNNELVVAELSPMPYVLGDGTRTVQQLVERALPASEAMPEPLKGLLGLQNLTPHSVPTKGQVVVVDYRYMSSLNPAITRNHDIRPQIKGTGLEAQLQQAGQWFWQDVPAELCEGVVLSADGVVDEQGRVWFLELNCNPLLHPSFYNTMLSGVFGLNASAKALQSPQAQEAIA
jgi:hypothetical protein